MNDQELPKPLPRDIRKHLEDALPAVLPRCRWFGGKSRVFRSIEVIEAIPLILPLTPKDSYLVLVSIDYLEGKPETYLLPLALAYDREAASINRNHPTAVLFTFPARNEEHKRAGYGIGYDALINKNFRASLYQAVLAEGRLQGQHGDIVPAMTKNFATLRSALYQRNIPSKILKGEQSNTSINFDSRFILKLFRRLEEGTNPDVEIGRFLTDFTDFKHSPRVVGTLEYHRKGHHEPITVGSLHTFVMNEGDSWSVFMKLLGSFTQALVKSGRKAPPQPDRTPLELAQSPLPAAAKRNIGNFLKLAELLGLRTIEMHLALAASTQDSAFKAEPFTLAYQRKLRKGMRKHVDLTCHVIYGTIDTLPKSSAHQASRLLELRKKIDARFDELNRDPVRASLIRTHGDYHLGQVLFTGDNFIIIDFEGEPARPLADRRFKGSPLRDVAGMLRSFHYASHVALNQFEASATDAASASHKERLAAWLRYWHTWVCTAYLRGYLSRKAPFLPRSQKAIRLLLDIYLLEKALYELVYEINNRPDWVKVPLSGILELLEDPAK